MSGIRRWLKNPQSIWLRRAILQLHLWTGIATGVYVLVVSITGSLVVYSNELYLAATPKPLISNASGDRLNAEQLRAAAARAYPGFEVGRISRPRNPRQAVAVKLTRGSETRDRLFDPITGQDVGDAAVPRSIRLVSSLLALHDELLAGRTGRRVNGLGGLCMASLALTGLVIWWPGVQRWRRSLIVHRRTGWRRLMWDLHSALGIWTLVFVLMFGITGAYLGYPAIFTRLFDLWEAPTADNELQRSVDQIAYWLAYLHFGRFGGRVAGCGRTCNTIFKAVWAAFGLAPAVLFVTGAIMWWNRVLRRVSLDPLPRAIQGRVVAEVVSALTDAGGGASSAPDTD